jgi:hypothetical protein
VAAERKDHTQDHTPKMFRAERDRQDGVGNSTKMKGKSEYKVPKQNHAQDNKDISVPPSIPIPE